MSYQSQLAELKSIIEKIEYYKYTTNSLIYWDKITYMPKNAISYRSKVMSFLAGEQYRLLSDSRFHKLAAYFKDNRKNDFLTDAMIKKLLVSAESVRAIPEAEYQRYVELIAVSEQVWAEAKEKQDLQSFLPYLKQIFDTFRDFTRYWGYEKEPYDALLEHYVEGLTGRDHRQHDRGNQAAAHRAFGTRGGKKQKRRRAEAHCGRTCQPRKAAGSLGNDTRKNRLRF